VTHRIQLLPKQLKFLRSTAPNVLYSGAVRAGKSYCLCIKAVLRATIPGAREGLSRKHLVTLKATTLNTLLRGDGGNPPVLPEGTYRHYKQDKLITLNGGGEIVYFGLDDPEKIGSYSLSGCGTDETAQYTEADYDMLGTRVSIEVPGLPRQLYGACNPGPPTHFLAKRFGLAYGAAPDKGYEAVQTRSDENWFLPQDYLDRINLMTGVRHKRLVLGLWVGSEGLVYDNWNRETHVLERSGPWVRVVIGVDYGYRNPFAAVKVGLDGDDRAHIIEERYGPGLTIEQMAATVVAMGGREVESVQVDPSSPLLIDALVAADVPASGGDNSVDDGIKEVRQRLDVLDDGNPSLTVDPTCENVQREFETYENILNKATGTYSDRPLKENDHAMDALRMALMRLRKVSLQIY
jgi:PBSX family phage terminase large subunit